MKKKVLLFAPRGFEDIEVAAFSDILGWTRVLKDTDPVELIITGFRRYIRSKHNLTIKAHLLIKDIDPGEYRAIIIPGGFNDAGYQEVFHKKVLGLIRDIYNSGGIVATMCVGALAAGRAGILKGKKATTYHASKRHDNLGILRECGALPVRRRIVVSDRIITNHGPDTSLDAALKLLEMLNGKKDVSSVKGAMMFGRL